MRLGRPKRSEYRPRCTNDCIALLETSVSRVSHGPSRTSSSSLFITSVTIDEVSTTRRVTESATERCRSGDRATESAYRRGGESLLSPLAPPMASPSSSSPPAEEPDRECVVAVESVPSECLDAAEAALSTRRTSIGVSISLQTATPFSSPSAEEAGRWTEFCRVDESTHSTRSMPFSINERVECSTEHLENAVLMLSAIDERVISMPLSCRRMPSAAAKATAAVSSSSSPRWFCVSAAIVSFAPALASRSTPSMPATRSSSLSLSSSRCPAAILPFMPSLAFLPP
mmetsp:Transcript_325/g.764  ORF Transcript_325/g.764 Transcript_325/m.764 type:complete len:286 (-) Transcript_325:87-944(-)